MQTVSRTLAPDVHKARLAANLLLAASVGVLIAAPDLAFAGDGGAEFDATYEMIVGWLQGSLGKLIAVAFVAVGIIMGVARQSIMAFAIGIVAGLGVYMTPDIIDSVVAATLPMAHAPMAVPEPLPLPLDTLMTPEAIDAAAQMATPTA